MSYRNNGAKPEKSATSKANEDQTGDSVDATQPYESDDDGEDIIERIRAKRKRDEALKSIPESKRIKLDDVKPGEPTVLIIVHNSGHYELHVDRFICQ